MKTGVGTANASVRPCLFWQQSNRKELEATGPVRFGQARVSALYTCVLHFTQAAEPGSAQDACGRAGVPAQTRNRTAQTRGRLEVNNMKTMS